jgi:hypothetical protein
MPLMLFGLNSWKTGRLDAGKRYFEEIEHGVLFCLFDGSTQKASCWDTLLFPNANGGFAFSRANPLLR